MDTTGDGRATAAAAAAAPGIDDACLGVVSVGGESGAFRTAGRAVKRLAHLGSMVLQHRLVIKQVTTWALLQGRRFRQGPWKVLD